MEHESEQQAQPEQSTETEHATATEPEPEKGSVGEAAAAFQGKSEAPDTRVEGETADDTPDTPTPGAFPDLSELSEQAFEEAAKHYPPHQVEYARAVAGAQRHLKAQTKELLDLVPAWKNADVRIAESQQLVEFAKRRGVSDEEIADFNLTGDARTISIWYAAMKADQRTNGPDPSLLTNPTPRSPAARPAHQSAWDRATKKAASKHPRVAAEGGREMYQLRAEHGPPAKPKLTREEKLRRALKNLERTGLRSDAAAAFAAREGK